MFNDYEDILTEPSEVDIIMNEMNDRLYKLLKSEAIEFMNAYRDSKQNLDEVSRELSRKRNQINSLKIELEELKEKHENADKYDMPRKYINKFVEEITGNFAPRDKVWIIEDKYEWVTCERCKGKKEISATIDGKEHMVKCIECEGHGRRKNIIKTIKETSIESVHLKLCFGADRVSIWSSDSVYVVGREYAMNPKLIFRTREEAQQELEGHV